MGDKVNVKGEIFKRKKDDPLKENAPVDKTVRINIRLSPEVLEFVRNEAKLSGTNVSSVCSMYVKDMMMQKKVEYRKLDWQHDISLFMEEPSFLEDLQQYINKRKK